MQDLVEPDLTHVGFETLGLYIEPDGHFSVATADCPGVRLRALVEVVHTTGATFPLAIAWHIVQRTERLIARWNSAGVEPFDTFIGFDGSLHLFPRLSACGESEAPSFMGNDSFDPLLVDGSTSTLRQLLFGEPPPTVFGSTEDSIPPGFQAFLRGRPSQEDMQEQLATLVRTHFPDTYERHHQAYQRLHLDPPAWGQARERELLDQTRPYDGPSTLVVHELPSGVPYAIEREPVRVAQLRRFASATGRPELAELARLDDDAIAHNVSHPLATAYARWIGRRLPTEDEQSAAAEHVQPGARWEWTDSGVPTRRTSRRAWRLPFGLDRNTPARASFRCVLPVTPVPLHLRADT